MSGLEEHKKKIMCLGCLRRKEKIDTIERYFLMWEAGVKQLVNNITELKHMKDHLDEMIAELKKDFDSDFTRCL
jgi:hypothetical protein